MGQYHNSKTERNVMVAQQQNSNGMREMEVVRCNGKMQMAFLTIGNRQAADDRKLNKRILKKEPVQYQQNGSISISRFLLQKQDQEFKLGR